MPPRRSNGARVPRKSNRARGRGRGGAARTQTGSGNASSGSMSGSIMNTGFSIRSMPLFPVKTRRNIQYYASGEVISGTGTASAYVFSANGCFDPDVTGTGGQPMGFDQAMTFYNHYTVLSCRARVVFNSNSTAQRASVGLGVSGSSTVTTNIEQLMENGNLTFKQLEYVGSMGGACTFARRIAAGTFQGIDDVMDDPNMRGDAASNPAEQAYFHLNVWNSNNATAVGVFFQILLEYDVVFTEPKKGSLSVTRIHQEDPILVETKDSRLEEVEAGILNLLRRK